VFVCVCVCLGICLCLCLSCSDFPDYGCNNPYFQSFVCQSSRVGMLLVYVELLCGCVRARARACIYGCMLCCAYSMEYMFRVFVFVLVCVRIFLFLVTPSVVCDASCVSLFAVVC